MFYLTLLLLLTISQAQIRPTKTPILNTIANRNEVSDYEISLIITNTVPPGGIIEIVFPQQYLMYLGIDQITHQTCIPRCNIIDRSVKFHFDGQIQPNRVIKLQLNQVLNPDKKGGTGNFIARTRKGDTIFDENLVFATIGIADYIQPLNSASVQLSRTGGQDLVGMNSWYDIFFKTGVYLPSQTYFKIQIPDCYTIGDLSQCIGYTCTKENEFTIVITNNNMDYQPLQSGSFKIPLINPPYSLMTNGFSIKAFRQGTSLVYSSRQNLKGVQIQPSTLINVDIQLLNGGINSRSKVVDYLIVFTTRNNIPNTGLIEIILPSNFLFVRNTDYDKVQVIDGIQSYNMEVERNRVVISQFNQISLTVKIILRLINSQTQGKSNPFFINTFYSQGRLIDTHRQLRVEIFNGATLQPIQAILSQPYAGQVTTDFTFTITPQIIIPSSGYIRLYFPDQWSIQDLIPASCRVMGIQSQTCTNSGKQVLIQVPAVIQPNVDATIQIINKIQTPLMGFSGVDLIDIETLNADGQTIVEISTIYSKYYPKRLSEIQIFMIGSERSQQSNPKYSIIVVIFTTIDQIQYPDGMISLTFGPSITWDSQLGHQDQQINCIGLPQSKCTLIQGDQPQIHITGFQLIEANSQVEIHIPQVLNPNAPTVEITLSVSYQSQIINQHTSTIPLANTGQVSQSTISRAIQFTQQVVQSSFVMTLSPGFSADIPVGSYILFILPTYDDGFLTDDIICQINNTPVTCLLYEGYDQILIPVTMAITAQSVPPPTVSFSNLKWPRTSDSVGYLRWTVFTGSPLIEQEKALIQIAPSNTQFPIPNPNDFLKATLLQFTAGKGFPGQTFVFEFQVVNKIPFNSQLRITFPSEFNLKRSQPLPECSWQDQYNVRSIIETSQVILTPSPEVNQSQDIIITCTGIQTPFDPPDNDSDGWRVELLYNNRIMNQRDNFFAYDYGNQFVPGVVQIIDLYSISQNEFETAEYNIGFKLQTPLKKYADIHITFPSVDYPELPFPPQLTQCYLSGAIRAFISCQLIGSTYQLRLDQDYEQGLILFKIDNVINPPSRTTDGFIIRTFYDGILVDASDESTLLNRTITISQRPLPINVTKIDFSPINQGLPSRYIFQFIIPVMLNIHNQLVIVFPQTYDRRLGDKLRVLIRKGRDAQDVRIQFKVENRRVILEQDEVPMSTHITITIENVINPNIQVNQNTGNFQIGILSQQYFYQALNSRSGVLETVQPPGWVYLQQIIPSNLYARWVSTIYEFKFTIWDRLPSIDKDGQIQISFPQQYDISDKQVLCSSTTIQDNLNCTFQNNILKVQGNQNDINGNHILRIEQVENPTSEVIVEGIFIKTYDNQRVVEQSYFNLDPFRFRFRFFSDLITINDDKQITITRGTESSDLFFKVQYPCSLNLSFTHTQSGNFSVTPQFVQLNQGQLQSIFRVQVPQNLKEGIYYIYWNTIGELNIPFYSPVKKTMVVVIQQKQLIQIHPINQIPIGGNSLQTQITTTNAPQQELIINIKTTDNTFYVQPSKLRLLPGINQVTYVVHQNATELQRQQELRIESEDEKRLLFSIGGHDQSIFYLSQPQLRISFTSPDYEPPKFIQVTTQPKQTKCSVLIEIDEVSQVYWSLSLQRTQVPSIQEILNQGPPKYLTTFSRYGQLIYDGNTYELVINNLIAQYPYVLFLVAVDREGLVSQVESVEFQTLNRYPSSSFNLVLYQSSLNKAERMQVVEKVGFVLSLPWNKVQEVQQDDQMFRLFLEEYSEEKDQYQDEQAPTNPFGNTLDPSKPQTTIKLDVIGVPNFQSPEQLILMLNQIKWKQLLLRYIPTFAPEQILQPIVYTGQALQLNQVKIGIQSIYSCEVQGTPNRRGWVFAMAQQQQQVEPTPLQIQLGLNFMNVAQARFRYKVNQPNSPIKFNITQLEPNRQYWIYLSTGSDQPGYPDLSQDVIQLKCQTQQLRKREPLTTLNRIIIQVLILVLFIL